MLRELKQQVGEFNQKDENRRMCPGKKECAWQWWWQNARIPFSSFNARLFFTRWFEAPNSFIVLSMV